MTKNFQKKSAGSTSTHGKHFLRLRLAGPLILPARLGRTAPRSRSRLSFHLWSQSVLSVDDLRRTVAKKHRRAMMPTLALVASPTLNSYCFEYWILWKVVFTQRFYARV